MNRHQLLLTKNNCYKNYQKHTVRGILVHSTGANNPYLKRYIGPDDGLLGKNPNGNHWNQPKPDGISKCVHAFIGKLNDGTIATYQTLPWGIKGWHSGSGRLGSSKNANNNGYIGFEICEDDLKDSKYFNAVYKEAVELCAHLCTYYNIKPVSPYLICHSEGSKLGIASNHGDVMHWFPKHGKSMDTFRADVAALMSKGTTPQTESKEVVATPKEYKVKVTADSLNIRSGPGTSYKIVGAIKDRGVYTIIEERNGWGKLKSKVGWIRLSYTKKI